LRSAILQPYETKESIRYPRHLPISLSSPSPDISSTSLFTSRAVFSPTRRTERHLVDVAILQDPRATVTLHPSAGQRAQHPLAALDVIACPPVDQLLGAHGAFWLFFGVW